VQRVREWRAAHPGYWRSHRRKARVALQDALIAQASESFENMSRSALQDALRSQRPVLIGLIAHLSDSALQEDIALTSRRLLQLGQDILARREHPWFTNDCCALKRCGAYRRSSVGSISDWCAIGTSSAAMRRRSRCIWCWSRVGDAQGLSYYGEATLARSLSMTVSRLSQARADLIGAGLIAYERPLYQVLGLDRTPPWAPAPRQVGMKSIDERLLQLRAELTEKRSPAKDPGA